MPPSLPLASASFFRLNATLQRWRARFLSDRHLHEFLWFCVPGVLAGFFVRAWLMAAMPYGYYHPGP